MTRNRVKRENPQSPRSGRLFFLSDFEVRFSLGGSAGESLDKLGCTSAKPKQAWLCVRFAQVFLLVLFLSDGQKGKWTSNQGVATQPHGWAAFPLPPQPKPLTGFLVGDVMKSIISLPCSNMSKNVRSVCRVKLAWTMLRRSHFWRRASQIAVVCSTVVPHRRYKGRG